ncbi:TRAP transporter large permease [Pararhodobacter aggregans]|uniref:TRAP transporter large permease protein n=1 Tax=Pararhodobacter aggregans TaxID=404875 RepID=A0A2T7UU83_9RHOB|nr:TRAP transporter large permease [Pararhodobacter aggregans]PTX03032.1 tripartite ATP-independent transporter DctM subunit [Pararhodobacter aggregans]PVE48232.1 TRAP transporter large permease [Pararhodobacter aggregans]
MDPLLLGIGGIVVMLALVALRVPLAVSLGLVGVGGMILLFGVPANRPMNLTRGFNIAWTYLTTEPYEAVASYTLIAIPLFLLMGFVAFYSGFTKDMYNTGRAWMSGLPGGLAMATVVGCAMFAAVSGSSLATAAAMGKLAVPEMIRNKYDKGLATGVVAMGGTLGALIPPSILMILYAIFTEQSVGRLLQAGIVPGLLSAGMFMLYIGIRATIQPTWAPRPGRVGWGERFGSLRGVWSVLVLFVLVMGGLYSGITTATESAAIGAIGAYAISFLGRRMTRGILRNSMVETVVQTSSIFAIVVGAKIFVGFITLTGVTTVLSDFFLHLDIPPFAVLLVISLLYIILGSFMEPLGIMLLTLPVVIPVIDGLGYDLIWFGIILIKLLEIGMITPPLGLNVFILKGVVGSEVKLETIFRGVAGFLLVDLVTLFLLMSFPIITLWLPNALWN